MAAAVFFVLAVVFAAVHADTEKCSTPGAGRYDASGNLIGVCTSGNSWQDVRPAWNNEHGNNAEKWLGSQTANCEGQAGNYVCSTTCEATGVCLSSGSWLLTDTCDTKNGEWCSQGQCVMGDNECESLANVQCKTWGKFPSLRDCSLYIDCDEHLNIEKKNCPNDTYFDACTGYCDVKADKCPWSSQFNPCQKVGDFGVAPNNARLFYICVRGANGDVITSWNRCETGFFDTTTLECNHHDVACCSL